MFKPTENPYNAVNKKAEPERITNYIKAQSQNQTLKKIRFEYLLSVVGELIEKEILTMSNTGKLTFDSNKLPRNVRIVCNGRHKVILAIENFCK